jgi:myo-inositol-1(or 4)-monophosphatase
MGANTYDLELKVAIGLARDVGKTLLRMRGDVQHVVKEQDGFPDLASTADAAAEHIVLSGLRNQFPGDAILSEESLPDQHKAPRLWIVDPLDGTRNYVHGLDFFGVSIALAVDNTIQVGVTYFPVFDSMHYAVRGKGYFVNDKPARLHNPNSNLKASIVSLRFPHKRTGVILDEAFDLYKRILISCSDLQRCSCSVYDVCGVATGKYGAYVATDIRPWDIASGALFVEEQGGYITNFQGERVDLFNQDGSAGHVQLVATKSKEIRDQLIKITEDFPL